MDAKELMNSTEIIGWFDVVSDGIMKDSTRKKYQQAMQKYTDFTGMTPAELIEEAEEEEENVKRKNRNIKKYFISFKTFLAKGGEYKNGKVQKGLAPKSIDTHVSSIKSFYDSQGYLVLYNRSL